MSEPNVVQAGDHYNGSAQTKGARKRTQKTRINVTAAEPQYEEGGMHSPLILPSASTDEPEGSGRRNQSILEQLKGDVQNVLLLLLLYLLQGIPLGLAASVPLILQSRQISYRDQAVFSFAFWPFSLKLLWAPIVDSCYFAWLGRRKSWLVPVQYLLGFFMFALSHLVTMVLGDHDDTSAPNVKLLTLIFFSLNFLAATQDIAVDGWALTMLSRKNVGWASTCNAVGQTAGFFLGNVVFLALESADFCNKWLRSPEHHTKEGLITLASFVYFWGIVYMVTTTLVLIFKKEKSHAENFGRSDSSSASLDQLSDEEVDKLGMVGTYKLLWDIVKLEPVITLIVIQLTAKIGFAAADGITGLKLVEQGVPKDRLAIIAIPLVPLQIILPWIIGRWTAGPKPLRVYLRAYPYRLVFGFIYAFIVYWTPSWELPPDQEGVRGQFPVSYYAIIIAMYCMHQITLYSIFVAQMSFFAQVADPIVGGTYMTLLNTITNLGGNWPVTLLLSLMDNITWRGCFKSSSGRVVDDMSMVCKVDNECRNTTMFGHLPDAHCLTTIDGYYILSVICPVIGIFWFLLMRRRIDRLQNISKDEWKVVGRNSNSR